MNDYKKIILTGDRPTGKLHLGHYVGSLRNRVKLQNSGEYETFIMIADTQALTDNAHDPEKIRDNLLNVALDYLAVGVDPTKSTVFIQSAIPALPELTTYYMNLVSLNRVLRNPTVKTEIEQKQMGESVPAGFAMYPVSQAADITAFRATHVPVGIDQEPMLEQTREIVRAVNSTYGADLLVEPEGVFPTDETAKRLPGLDSNAKMSKSLNNGIYLSDDEQTLHDKVFSMYTDPRHVKISDPGHIAGNTVFTYLDVFAPMTKNVERNLAKVAELKSAYQKGGLGDVATKQFLFEILNEILTPIRQRRAEFAKDTAKVYEILRAGNMRANTVANQTLHNVKTAIFSDKYLG
ncbi:MAG: tryptophan--tRNA ligase [Candidatus Nanoperiomorbaceae bacterium]